MNTPTLDDVLDAFSVEVDYGKATLESYIRKYPQFALDLVELSRKLLCAREPTTSPLSGEEVAQVDTAWRTHIAAGRVQVADPLALDASRSKQLALALNVPRQVITAFRERRVDLSSVPRHFLQRFAASLDTAVEQLIAALSQTAYQPARSYSSDDKPVPKEQVKFESLLVEAGLSQEQCAALMAGGE